MMARSSTARSSARNMPESGGAASSAVSEVGGNSSSDNSRGGAKMLLRRCIKQAFLAMRKTQGRTRSGSRSVAKLSKTLSRVSCATSSASSGWPHISQL